MKTIHHFRTILTMGIVLSLMILVVISCKKKDDTPQPDPTPPVPPPVHVFNDPQHSLMSDYEISNHRSFQAHPIYSSMKVGIGPMDIFKAAFGIFSAIEKYKKEQAYQAEVNKINSSLNNIQTQLGVLENDFTALAAQLQFDMNQLMNEVYVLSSISATAPIITAYSNADENGFRWYSDQAMAHNSGSSGDSIYMATQITPRMNNFIANYSTGVYSTTLQNAIVTLNGYVMPSTTTAGLLNILSRNIISQNKPADPMEQYMILENYFLQIANYQMQAMVIQLNCFTNDSADYQSFSKWYAKLFLPQINQFLQAVNFLGVSLYDYRNQEQYTNDLQYLNFGLSPETHTSGMMARAQFVANLLADACGIPAPVMCGSIILPHYYNAGTGATPIAPFNVNVWSTILAPRTDTTIKSPFPYTYWNFAGSASDNSAFAYDNQWQVFNYGKFGTVDNTYPCTPQALSLNSASWGNTEAPEGAATPLWYNPRDPTQTSTTKTDSCVIQFAYFAASWKWGYMGLCLVPASLRSTNALGTMIWDCHYSPTCPFVQQWHSSQDKFESSGGTAIATNPNGNRLFQENFYGDFGTYSGGWIYAAEFTYFNATPANDLGQGINLYMNYSYSLTSGWASGFYFYNFNLGTGIEQNTACSSGYICNGDILAKQATQMSPSISGSGSVIKSLSSGAQRLSFEIEVGMHDLSTTTTYNTQVNLYPQYVYSGRTGNW